MSPNSFIGTNAVLIYGPRKAGTTLLHRLLDSSVVFCHEFETKLKYVDKVLASLKAMQENYDISPPTKYFPYAALATERKKNRYLQVLKESFDRFGGMASFVEADVRAYAAAEKLRDLPSTYCIKEVGGKTFEIINGFLNAFPTGRVISIRRDPRFVARSVFRDRERRGVKLHIADILHQAREPWLVDRSQMQFTDHPRVRTLTYEQLVSDPSSQMAMIASFLKVPFDHSMLRPTLHGIETEVRTASKSGFGLFQSDAEYSDGLTLKQRVAIEAFALKFNRSADR